MIILALDLGTNTGWKIGDTELSVSGTQNFGNSRFDGGGVRFIKFIRFLDQIAAEKMKPDLVVFEEVRNHAGNTAAHVYGGFWSHLMSWCEKQGIPYTAVPVQTIKKFATGKGNASKTDMIVAAQAKGFEPADDNEADAIWLWEYAQKQFAPA